MWGSSPTTLSVERPTGITLPGGTRKQYTYDPLMRTKSIAGSDPVRTPHGLHLPATTRWTTSAEEHRAGNYAYNYDDLYRLNEVRKEPAQTEAYTYDPVGNRLTSTAATDWTYNLNNELQGYSGTTYQYDANGNTTQKNAAADSIIMSMIG